MIDGQILGFIVVAAALTIIPGADMALVARSVLAAGRRAGYVTSLGCCTGLFIHAVASARARSPRPRRSRCPAPCHWWNRDYPGSVTLRKRAT